ncbi:helix-turn-helix domain-containing protein [Pyrobaculum aerophilum]|uniref:Putative HTH-type transcriptional regulatory protein CGL51_07270 n=1 Tax=Pyrobaculum aerophilum TaxID=13773 RepID=A0A371QY79_9CREN|nr:helix-turn-helix domain-containing protein [Pyrobaculum aerophilum]RFA95680.1 transcriptional regulator [Pyrobaculum aerophilum]RFB00205.1 transcriptional regulator [Pyrobaculum aerophilum]
MERLLSATLNVIKNRGEQLFIDVARPYAYTLVAKFDNRKYIMKIAKDAEEVSQSAIKDLKLLSFHTNTPSICVVSSVKGYLLQRGVVYLRNDIVFMSLATLADILEGIEPIFKLNRGVITASIDGEKLRAKREQAGMSLGALAANLGVTRETVYRYERGEIEAPLKVAEKIIRIFGEDVAKKIDINEKPRVSQEELASRQIGTNIYKLLESHPDAIKQEDKTILISEGAERYQKTVELAYALGAEVERM